MAETAFRGVFSVTGMGAAAMWEAMVIRTLAASGMPPPCDEAVFEVEGVSVGAVFNWRCDCHGWHFKTDRIDA